MYFGCEDANKNCKYEDKTQKCNKTIAKTMIMLDILI
jgi:hypothetical protein